MQGCFSHKALLIFTHRLIGLYHCFIQDVHRQIYVNNLTQNHNVYYMFIDILTTYMVVLIMLISANSVLYRKVKVHLLQNIE